MPNAAADTLTRAWWSQDGIPALPCALIRVGDLLVNDDDGVTVEVEGIHRTQAGVLLTFTDASSPWPVPLDGFAQVAAVTFLEEDGPTLAPVAVHFDAWVAQTLRAFLTGPTGAGLPA